MVMPLAFFEHPKDDKAVFDLLFSTEVLLSVFQTRFLQSGAKGIDRRGGFQFAARAAEELASTSSKCLAGTFQFSPYLENLKQKGRGKAPRVIGIPTIRDRVVLHQLNRFLAFVFPACVPRNIASTYVRNVAADLGACDPEQTWVSGCDIQTFYDSIRRDRLLKIVAAETSVSAAIHLVRAALSTPTVPKGARRHQYRTYRTEKGVPQGLAISNILASIYMQSVDAAMRKLPVKYLRYVDDVLIYGEKTAVEQAHKTLRGKLRYRGLAAHPVGSGKSHVGYATQPFGYLGYYFAVPKVTVRPSTVERFLQSLAGKFSEYAHNKKRKLERYKYLTEQRLKDIFVLELNERITGAISENRRYGWIAYFSEINDLTLLYKLDHAVASLFARLPDFNNAPPTGLKKLSRAIYEIKFNPLGGYVHNYDQIETPTQKLQFLAERGWVDDNEPALTEQQIEDRFSRYRQRSLSQMQADEGLVY